MNDMFPPNIHSLGILSLSGFTNDEQAIARGQKLLEHAGLTLIRPRLTANHQRFLAAPDRIRVQQLHELLDNPKVDAIMALKGGYGAARILNLIDWERIRARNLPVIGFSDLTAFHLAALKHGCRNHVYGPMLASTCGQPTDTPERQRNLDLTLESLSNLLHQHTNLLTFGQNQIRVLKPGKADAPIVPATLSVLCSLVGTPHMPNLAGHILALEDINEPAHRIDGYLNQLRNAGILQRLSGLIFGTFTNAEDGEFIPEILQETCSEVRGPVIADLPFGHCLPTLSLPVGMNVLLDATDDTVSLTRSPKADFASKIFNASDHATVNYRWLEPETQAPGTQYPLILFLHGAGERGMDNQVQMIHVLPKFLASSIRQTYPCFIAAPQCPDNEQWVNTPWDQTEHIMPHMPAPSLRHAMELVEELSQCYPIDPKRIYVMGLSMGGYGVWDIIARRPDLFAAAVPMCGGGDEDMAHRFAHLPIWAFHGEVDSAVPACRSRRMVQRLRDLQGNITYTEIPNCNHDVWTPAIETPELIPWLFAQHK